MKIAISSESTCDLSKEIIEKYDIKIVPYSVILGDEILVDNEDVPDKIYKYVEETKVLPKTSAINELQYKEYFEEILKDYDAVIHITLSSGITSAVSHAEAAISELKNVYLIDSKSLSTGIALLCIYAKNLIDSGLEVEEIVEKVKARVSSVQASFVIDKLDYLYKGGRCNALIAFGANLLKIHPQIVLKEGLMKTGKKYRGKMERVVIEYAKDTLEEFNNPDKEVVFVTHTKINPEIVENLKNLMLENGFKNVYETTAGGTITSHCGEATIGILYLNDGNQE